MGIWWTFMTAGPRNSRVANFLYYRSGSGGHPILLQFRPWKNFSLKILPKMGGRLIHEIDLYTSKYGICKLFTKIPFLTFDLGPKSKVMAPNESPYMISYMSTIQMESLSLIVPEIFAKKCSFFHFWPWTKVKGHGTIWKSIYDFLYVYNTIRVSNSNGLRDICKNNDFDLWPWTKVRGHGTKWKPIYDFVYVHNTNGVSISQGSRNICKKNFFDLWPWTKVRGHGTKWKPIYDFVYVHNTNGVSISQGSRNICKKNFFDLWPWTKVRGHGTKWKPIYDFLYVYNTNGVSISHSLRDICKNSFLTFDLGPRSEVMAPNESPYMISYMSTTQMKSLSLIVCKISEQNTFQGHLGSKVMDGLPLKINHFFLWP